MYIEMIYLLSRRQQLNGRDNVFADGADFCFVQNEIHMKALCGHIRQLQFVLYCVKDYLVEKREGCANKIDFTASP